MKASEIKTLLDLWGTVAKIKDKVSKHGEVLNVAATHVIYGAYALVVRDRSIRLFCPTETTIGFGLADMWVEATIDSMALDLSKLPPSEIVGALERWDGIEAWLDSLVVAAAEQKKAQALASAAALTEADLAAQKELEARMTIRRLE